MTASVLRRGRRDLLPENRTQLSMISYLRKGEFMSRSNHSEAQEAKQLRDENTRLKKLVVDLSLDKEMLKAVIAKNGWSS